MTKSWGYFDVFVIVQEILDKRDKMYNNLKHDGRKSKEQEDIFSGDDGPTASADVREV